MIRLFVLRLAYEIASLDGSGLKLDSAVSKEEETTIASEESDAEEPVGVSLVPLF